MGMLSELYHLFQMKKASETFSVSHFTVSALKLRRRSNLFRTIFIFCTVFFIRCFLLPKPAPSACPAAPDPIFLFHTEPPDAGFHPKAPSLPRYTAPNCLPEPAGASHTYSISSPPPAPLPGTLIFLFHAIFPPSILNEFFYFSLFPHLNKILFLPIQQAFAARRQKFF